MARAALGWGVRDLADKAGINANTISRFEGGKGALTSTVDKILGVFEAEGVHINEAGCVCPPPMKEKIKRK
jgi:transcriptional regulator with XRE-family HTH domain